MSATKTVTKRVTKSASTTKTEGKMMAKKEKTTKPADKKKSAATTTAKPTKTVSKMDSMLNDNENLKTAFQPVSYTHLTLPTIYSV